VVGRVSPSLIHGAVDIIEAALSLGLLNAGRKFGNNRRQICGTSVVGDRWNHVVNGAATWKQLSALAFVDLHIC
jgi:hypothetical protein